MDVPAQPSDDQSTRITRTISNVTSFLGSFPSILGIEDDTPLLVRLVGVEDAPERQIRSEHETVREVARERSS